jgi:hydrogenase nickel incorporation protein HypA/HybF
MGYPAICMHELSIAQNILEIVEQHLPPGNGYAVKSVKLKLGELAGVVQDSLEFCFCAIIPGTRVAGATLDIERIPLRARCEQCYTVFAVEENDFSCSACGGSAVSVVSGRELQVTEIEIDDAGVTAT